MQNVVCCGKTRPFADIEEDSEDEEEDEEDEDIDEDEEDDEEDEVSLFMILYICYSLTTVNLHRS